MTGNGADARAVLAHADAYLAEDDVLLAARARGAAAGAVPVAAGCGAALRFLAATIRARAVVEVGTGAGVSGLWLLHGMAADGVLTSIDVDPEHQRTARTAFTDAGYGPSRLRLINGMGLEVLSRLTDGAYDLVFVDAADGTAADYPRYLDEAVRLLRAGGVLALGGLLRDGRDGGWVGDPAATDPGTVGLREVSRQVREDERLVPVLLPLGTGLLCATRL